MATRQSPAHCGHSWQKIKGTEQIGEENGVEWLEVCIHRDARRRMGKRLGTEPARLPRQCVRRVWEESVDGTQKPGRDRGRPAPG